MTFLARKWRQQPQGAVSIDYNNPSSRGLVLAYLPNFSTRGHPLIRGQNFTPNAGTTLVPGLGGRAAYTGNGSGAITGFPVDIGSDISLFTFLVVITAKSISDVGWFLGSSDGASAAYIATDRTINIFRNSATVVTSTNTLPVDKWSVVSGSYDTAASINCRIFINGVMGANSGIESYGTALPVRYIGASPSQYAADAKSALVIGWNRRLIDVEHYSLHENPWQLFKKETPITYFMPLIPRVIKTINVTGDGNIYANVDMTYRDWSGNIKGTTVTLSPATSYVKPNSFVDATVTVRNTSDQPVTNANVFVMGINRRISVNVATYNNLSSLSAPVDLGNVSPSGYKTWRFYETAVTSTFRVDLWSRLTNVVRNDARYVRMEFRSSRGAIRLDHTGQGYCEIGISPGNPVPTKYTYNPLTFGGEVICIPKGNDWYDLLVYTPKCDSTSGDIYIVHLLSPTDHSSGFAGNTQQYIDVGKLEVGSGNVVPFIGTTSNPSISDVYNLTASNINEISPSGKAVQRLTETATSGAHDVEFGTYEYKANTWNLITAEVRDTAGRGNISIGFYDDDGVDAAKQGGVLTTSNGRMSTYLSIGGRGEVFAGAKNLQNGWWEIWAAWRWDAVTNVFPTIGIQTSNTFGVYTGDISKYIDIGNVWLLKSDLTPNDNPTLRSVALFDNTAGTANLFVMQRSESIENAAIGNVIVSPYGGQSEIGVSSFPWTPRVRITSL